MPERPPALCRLLLAVSERLANAAVRRDFRREWDAELSRCSHWPSASAPRPRSSAARTAAVPAAGCAYAAAIAVFAVVAVIAALVPCRRALAVDPVVTLKAD